MDSKEQEPGRLSRKERTRRQHRDEIIAAATELFARSGYDGTSMQMIADRAGISVGKLYFHFEGKEDIYRSVVEHHAAEIRRHADEAIGPSMSPIDSMRARTRAIIDYIEENDALVRFYVSEMQGMSGKWSHMVKAQHDMHMTEYTSLVREAIERGEIPEEDPELLTAMIQGAGHAMLAVVVERDDLPYSAVIEYVDRMILRPLEERKRGEKNEEGGE